MRRSLLCAALGCVLLSSGGGIAGAAVRVCLPAIASAAQAGATETEARRKALEDWSSKAGASGEGFGQWRTANDKSVVCRRQGGREFVCAARASPCRISQVPLPRATPKAVPGRVPRPKLLEV